MAAARMLARGLGLFSLGLGLYQVVAPREFAQLIGLRPRPEREAATRALGARELGAAAGLLARPRPVAFMWMRVAGDALDLILLRRAMRSRGSQQDRLGTATASVVGVTALDVLGSVLVTREAVRNRRDGHNGRGDDASLDLSSWGGGEIHRRDETSGTVVKSITIQRPRPEVYATWRDFTRLPEFMHHLESVTVDAEDGRRSHWKAKAPLGTSVEWDAEMTEDIPNERIAWRSLPDSRIRTSGVVRFEDAPADRGTIVRVELEYDPPGGPLGAAIGKLTGEEPSIQTAQALRRFKQVMELGEVPVSEATIGGRRVRQRPARPLEPDEATKALSMTER